MLLTVGFLTLRVAAPKYRHTMWSTVTGRQLTQELFTKGERDEAKILVFRKQRMLWEGDIGEDVKQWTMENWARWEEEMPEWFTPKVVSTVPDKYIPKARLEVLGYNRKRRGSASKSVRESL